MSPGSDPSTASSASNESSSGQGLSANKRSISAEHLQDAFLGVKHDVPHPTRVDSKDKFGDWKRKTQTTCVSKWSDVDQVIESMFPFLKWLKVYDRSNLSQDIIAGLTVGIMIIPQSMSYAKLAGLPVEYGLYSALMPVFAYAIWGTSRQLAVGPVALVSLLVSTGLTSIVDPVMEDGSIDQDLQDQYNILAIETAFLVGVVYLIMGTFRLGFVTIVLSHAVVSGFTTGAAIIIGFSQVKYFFGYEVERSKVLHEGIHYLLKDIDKFDWKTFTMGMGCLGILMAMKNIGKAYPKLKWVRAIAPLTVTTLSILITWAGGLDIPIVEDIPKGLPPFTVNRWELGDVDKLVTPIISISIVGFMESIAIAKQLASKHKYEIDSSQELIGLGMSNFIGAMFGAYPITGSFSRSAVNHESGAKSGISAICTALLVGIILLLLTPVFEQMPLATLASIVISGVLGLLDYEEGIFLWHVHKLDFAIWMFSFLGTLFLGAEKGLGISVGLSLLFVLYESAYPHTAVLGKLPGTNVYRNVKQYPTAQTFEQIVIARVDAPIFFANTQHVREKLQKYEWQAENKCDADGRKPIKFMIVDFSPVSSIDTSGIHIMKDLYEDYSSRDVQLCLCNPNITVMQKLVDGGLVKLIGEKYMFVSTYDAVQACLHELEEAELLGGADVEAPAVEEAI